MQMTRLKNKLSLIFCIVLIAAMTLSTTACSSNTNNNSDGKNQTEQSTSETENAVLGEGKTEFFVTVTDADGKETSFTVHTDKKTVGEALLDVNLIAGDEGEYGLYIKTVNGITVDYEKDGKYWAFYADGAYASAGVDSTDIAEGSTYSFKVE